jgi:coenzyme Q-binding protein COQ10
MPQFSTKRHVQHSASDMFELVADVERYPQFVPLCRSLRVRKRSDDSEGREVIVADMTVAYKLIYETFTSRVTLDRPKLEILVEYLEGPFRKMNNRWRFHPAGRNGCDVEFFISYEFRSRTLGLLMGAVFDAAFRRFSAAFERRADQIYGARAG